MMKRYQVFEPMHRHPCGSAAHRSPNGTAITQYKTAELITQGRLTTAQRAAAAWIDASPRMLALRRHAAALQREGEGLQTTQASRRALAGEVEAAQSAGRSGLPDHLKSGIEAMSGVAMGGVKVHYNSPRPAQLNARAYARGTDIHLGPGQEHHLPHEAWHIVQQAQGRVKPTMQMQGGVPVNDDRSLEREADVMGNRAVQMKGGVDAGGYASMVPSASELVQRKLTGSGENLTETQLGKVKKLDEFNVGDKKFVVLKKVSPPNEESKEAHEIYVHNIAGDNNIPYSEWIKQPWRTWTGDLEKGGESKERKDMPPSTDSIPLTLYKRVNVDHLDSISKTPLESTPQRIVFQGYSKGSKYMTRDLAIAAVWLGKSTQPGESMQPVSGCFIDLKITVSSAFRDAYLRDVYAVLHGSDEKVGDTVLCFAPIVPGMVAVTLTENDMMLIKNIDAKTRLKVGDNVLSRIDSKDIKNIIAAFKTGGNEDD